MYRECHNMNTRISPFQSSSSSVTGTHRIPRPEVKTLGDVVEHL
jgi:hypothetical protein